MRSGGRGGKNRRKGKSRVGHCSELIFRDPETQVYAYVSENTGNRHYRLRCGGDHGDAERLGVLRGSMLRRVWVHRGDIVLATLREYQEGKVDIVHKYTYDEVVKLISHGEITGAIQQLYHHGSADADDIDNDGCVAFESVDAI